MTVTLAVASAKGGVGKTTTGIGLGGALAGRGHRTGLVECDLATANVTDQLALEGDPEEGATLHDLLADGATLRRVRYAAPGGFEVVPAGTDLDGFAAADPRELEAGLAELEGYDYVLLDTGPGVSDETLRAMELADAVILVSTPRPGSVRDTAKTLELLDRAGGTPAGLVLTRSGSGVSPSGEEIAEFLGVDLLGQIPEDEAIPAAQDAGQPVTEHAPESPAAEAYRAVAAELDRRYGADAPADADDSSQVRPSSEP